jgi:pimeloyl-ACP methyl ester carboxylesterase
MPKVDNGGVKIHYEIEGHGPSLMLMHGFSADSRSWHALGYVKELNNENQLILVDARGHGASDKPHVPEAYQIGLMVSDLVAVLDDLGVSKANYFGYSMGGRIGFRIPQYASSRFSSLILGGANYPIHGDEDAKDEILSGISKALEVALKMSPANPMAMYVSLIEKASGQQVDAESRALLMSNDALALQAASIAHRREVSIKADEALPRFTMPCLLLVGEADPRYQAVKECAGRMPNASVFSFARLDHLQGLQRSDLVLPHVKRFLARNA